MGSLSFLRQGGLRWLVVACVVTVVVAFLGIPILSAALQLVLLAGLVLLLIWAGWRLYHRALWTVGRRLAFSYFLTGLVPIPLLVLLLGAVGYLLSGFLLGHLYHDAVLGAEQQLRGAAAHRLAEARQGREPSQADAGNLTYTFYLDGRRFAGDERLPERWPAWADDETAEERFISLEGQPTLAAAVRSGRSGVIATWQRDLEAELSQRADVWVVLHPPIDEEDEDRGLQLTIGTTSFSFQRPQQESLEEARQFFRRRSPRGTDSTNPSLWDRPLLLWAEKVGPLYDAASGDELAPSFAVTLRGTPRTVHSKLFSTTAELDASLWMALFVFAFLLFDVYVVAAIVAAFMIFTLSQAVGRLSRATGAVRQGDFSVRIPVKRNDQVGELQRSFNAMTEHLEELVTTATEKELLEKELEIARQLQQSLLPRDLPEAESIEFSTLFAPSAAIGGDYFDVLSLGEGRLAVVVADVSGHGLPTGLRMAMIKAALTILASEGKAPTEIFERLDALVREDRRVFVTATIAVIDLEQRQVEITNAGHPPTYRIRGFEVDEIALPGSPLGGLGRKYGFQRLTLRPGDVLVWLSDGLIEAVDGDGRPFGYGAVARALRESPPHSATLVRDRLLAAVEEHTGGRPVGDDRTVVVMRFREGVPAPASSEDEPQPSEDKPKKR
ncbi:MAG: SpoIIE family protein phosphatase [Acidobacteriota bacterium]